MDAVDYNPLIEFVDRPIYLEDKIKESGYPITSYLEYDTKRREYIRHIYAQRHTKTKGYECMEIFREYESGKKLGKNFYYNSYGNGAGFHVIWQNKYSSCYYGLLEKENKFKGFDWADIKIFNAHQLTSFEDIVKWDLSLKYCKWNENVDALNYIQIYKKYPIVEMLMKLELYHLVFNEKCILYMMENKSFCKWLYKNRDRIKNNRIAFPNLKTSYKKGYDVTTYNNQIINKRIEAKRLSDAIGRDNYRILKGFHIDYEKLIKYIHNVGENNYKDYLESCIYFKLDLSDTKVLLPKDFRYWHDFYTQQMTADKNKEIDVKIKEQSTKYKNLIKPFDDDIKMSFPNCTQDFINEGEALHHCVGRMGYNKKMANGESLIIFVRKEEDKPLYTMEYDPKGKKIKQLYGDHDTQPEESIKDIIYNKWLPKVKRMRFA